MHYAIIGNSLLSVKIAEGLRQANQEAEISLFCPEGVFPYHRHLLPGLLLDKKFQEITCVPADFYAANRIKLFCDKKIAKVHPKRKRILTEDKEQIPFDVVIIEDGGAISFADIKGAQKQGVFHLKTVKDAEAMTAYLGLAEIAIVEVDHIAALQTAYHLRKLNKDVIVVAPSGHLLSELIDKDVADYIVEQLQKEGIRFIFHNAIVEVLGDAEAKAIRLKTGKVLESQLVFLSQAEKNLDILNAEELVKEENDYCIKYEDVYCVKDLKATLDRSLWEESFISQYALAAQAKNIVAFINRQEPVAIESPMERGFELGHLVVSFLGTCKKEDRMTAYMKVNYQINAYKKIFIQEDIVKGAALVNNQQARASLAHLITERANVRERGISIIDG